MRRAAPHRVATFDSIYMHLSTALAGAAALAAGVEAGSYRAAVVQITLAADNTLKSNLATYTAAAAAAAQAGADIITFPEFALGLPTSDCTSPTTPPAGGFCEPMAPAGGVAPCGSSDSPSWPPIQATASCAAQAAKAYVAVNTCELGTPVDDPSGAVQAWNTQLVYDRSGALVARYRKSHPFFTKCFAKPSVPDLVTFNFTAPSLPTPLTMGVFTCYDILFSSPGPVLAEAGVEHFVYSAAIPLVDSLAVETWSAYHNATMLNADLQAGQSGIFVRGKRVTASPPSSSPPPFSLVVADVEA